MIMQARKEANVKSLAWSEELHRAVVESLNADEVHEGTWYDRWHTGVLLHMETVLCPCT